MSEISQKIPSFIDTYNKSCRLAAAVFVVSNTMNQDEELGTIIKRLSLKLISLSVALKDINFTEAKKAITEIEKNSLELLSMLDIASMSGLISKMNAEILREEFQAFISELGKFKDRFGSETHASIKKVFEDAKALALPDNDERMEDNEDNGFSYERSALKADNPKNGLPHTENNNGHKRKSLRKNTILEFIKRHGEVGIKDIVPNVPGCSEKTLQRELLELIKEGKVKKTGERRWSRYSA